MDRYVSVTFDDLVFKLGYINGILMIRAESSGNDMYFALFTTDLILYYTVMSNSDLSIVMMYLNEAYSRLMYAYEVARSKGYM